MLVGAFQNGGNNHVKMLHGGDYGSIEWTFVCQKVTREDKVIPNGLY